MAGTSSGGEVFRVRESFAIPDADGFLRTFAAGSLIAGVDRIVGSHRAFLEPVGDSVEAATAAPGERRSLRLPSAVRQRQATKHQTGHAHTGDDMPHLLPPEDPNSPASPFAPLQPAAGVVADDVPSEQNLAGGPKAADAPAAETVVVDSQNNSGEAGTEKKTAAPSKK